LDVASKASPSLQNLGTAATGTVTFVEPAFYRVSSSSSVESQITDLTLISTNPNFRGTISVFVQQAPSSSNVYPSPPCSIDNCNAVNNGMCTIDLEPCLFSGNNLVALVALTNSADPTIAASYNLTLSSEDLSGDVQTVVLGTVYDVTAGQDNWKYFQLNQGVPAGFSGVVFLATFTNIVSTQRLDTYFSRNGLTQGGDCSAIQDEQCVGLSTCYASITMCYFATNSGSLWVNDFANPQGGQTPAYSVQMTTINPTVINGNPASANDSIDSGQRVVYQITGSFINGNPITVTVTVNGGQSELEVNVLDVTSAACGGVFTACNAATGNPCVFELICAMKGNDVWIEVVNDDNNGADSYTISASVNTVAALALGGTKTDVISTNSWYSFNTGKSVAITVSPTSTVDIVLYSNCLQVVQYTGCGNGAQCLLSIQNTAEKVGNSYLLVVSPRNPNTQVTIQLTVGTANCQDISGAVQFCAGYLAKGKLYNVENIPLADAQASDAYASFLLIYPNCHANDLITMACSLYMEECNSQGFISPICPKNCVSKASSACGSNPCELEICETYTPCTSLASSLNLLYSLILAISVMTIFFL